MSVFKIELTTTEEFASLKSMFPDEIMKLVYAENVIVLSAKDLQDMILGCAVFTESSHYMELQWIYVIPEARGRGIGSCLLNRLEKVMQSESHFVGICADFEEEQELTTFFKSSGFSCSLQSWPLYEFRLKEVAEIKKYARKMEHIVKLSECDTIVKQDFTDLIKASGYPLKIPVIWENYDMDFSQVYLYNNKIAAIALFENWGEQMNLAFVYAKGNPMMLPVILGNAYEQIEMAYGDKNPKIFVTVLEEHEEKLLLKILPTAKGISMSHVEKYI